MKRKIFIPCCGLILTTAIFSLLFRRSAATELRLVNESQPCTAADCFEGISHFRYLYDGSTKVSQVDEADISPSGQFAAFDHYDETIKLYKKGTKQIVDITDGRFAIPERFDWDEPNNKLVITYYQDNPDPIYAKHPPSTIDLR